ncbi:MAG: helix-turn-helix transcriptional regulator [Acidobacteria bacterium]|nr:helix-turn-helix transcriptional regulator [Acidobacteriota bacterium]
MRCGNPKYDLYHRFIAAYAPFGFRGVDRSCALMQELEHFTERNDQYFFVGDLFQGRILLASERSIEMIGVDPAKLTPYDNLQAVHPAEVHRNTNGWAKLLHMANELLDAKGGASLLSVNMKMRTPKGKYREVLFQSYVFYSRLPYETVYVLVVLTDLQWFKERTIGFHHYVGSDLANFRFPDRELLMTGHHFSPREFEILDHIEKGLNSVEIADKLFISVNTVDTHRKNILAKTEKAHISDLIYELKDDGLL